MNILAFDTSTSLLCAALLVDAGSTQNHRCFELCIEDGLRHAEIIIGALDSLCTQAGLARTDINVVVCGNGPGSFTGLRIGMATAKGLAVALDSPFCSISALDAMAWRKRYWPGLVVPIIDARKKRFYAALYRQGERVSEYLDLSSAGICDYLEQNRSADDLRVRSHILVTGPDAGIFWEQISGPEPDHEQQPLLCLDLAHREGFGRALAELGLQRAQRGDFDSLDIGPEYVRSSDAEIGISRGSPAV